MDFKVLAASNFYTQSSFPQFSISIYDQFDGTNFYYKRQQVNGKQILSTIVSDDYFPLDQSEIDKENYINGFPSSNGVFYAKIIVFSSQLDTNPSSYIFKRTFNNVTAESPMNLISQQGGYSVYWSNFSLPISDYISQLDGNIFFNVTQAFNIEISTPITINCSNGGVVTDFVSSGSSANILSASQMGVFSQYFSNSFSFSQLSYSVFNFNTNSSGAGYIQTTQNNPSFVFDPTQSFYNFYGSLFELQINFLKDGSPYGVKFVDNKIYYFGCTLLTNDALLNLQNASLNLYLKTSDGNFYNIEPIVILQNRVNTLAYNFVFKFSNENTINKSDQPHVAGGNILLPNDSVISAILKINLNTFPSSTNLFTTLTYFNFLKTDAVSAFSALSTNDQLNVYDIFKRKQNYFEIFKDYPLASENEYCLAENYLEVESEVAYKIKTKNFEALLDEFMTVYTNDGLIQVSNLNKNYLIKTIDGFQKIEQIITFFEERVMTLETSEKDSYYLNGILVKNPVYLKKFTRIFIPNKNFRTLNQNYVTKVNNQDFFATKEGSLLKFDINKNIFANEVVDAEINFNFEAIAIIIDSADVVNYKVNGVNYKTNFNTIIINSIDKKISLRSPKDFTIKYIYSA